VPNEIIQCSQFMLFVNINVIPYRIDLFGKLCHFFSNFFSNSFHLRRICPQIIAVFKMYKYKYNTLHNMKKRRVYLLHLKRLSSFWRSCYIFLVYFCLAPRKSSETYWDFCFSVSVANLKYYSCSHVVLNKNNHPRHQFKIN
jgi:hypothetical protein